MSKKDPKQPHPVDPRRKTPPPVPQKPDRKHPHPYAPPPGSLPPRKPPEK